jgi:hypothetical protein
MPPAPPTRQPQFVVRWSVFLLGPAGCGKSAIWRTLMKAQNNSGEKTVYRPINPKAVTRNELYGFLHPQVRGGAAMLGNGSGDVGWHEGQGWMGQKCWPAGGGMRKPGLKLLAY